MKLTAFNAGIKGKVAGTVFQSSPWGQVLRTTPIDAVKSGGKLTHADAGRTINPLVSIAKNATRWRTLTTAQRLAWATSAVSFPFKNKWGESYTASGYQVFMSINANLINAGQGTINTPPDVQLIESAPAFTCEVSIIASSMQVFNLVNLTNTQYILSATPAMSAGAFPKKSNYKIIYNQPATGAVDRDITDEYETIYGYIPYTGTINYRLDAVNTITGQKGVPSYFTLTP